MELIQQIEFPNFPLKVKTSNARRKKYYTADIKKRKKEIPLKYYKQDTGSLKDQYEFRPLSKSNKELVLYNVLLGEPVLANPKAAGTPNFMVISGNSIYSAGKGSERNRLIIAKGLQDYYRPLILQQMKKFELTDYPLIVESEIYIFPEHSGAANWDISNLWIYNKVLEDILQEMGFLVNDHIKYITKSGGSPLFFPIEADIERKLVFKFYKDSRPEVSGHRLYIL